MALMIIVSFVSAVQSMYPNMTHFAFTCRSNLITEF